MRWKCSCSCGAFTVVKGGTLRSGRTLSCGCLQVERSRSHGGYKTPEYRVWKGILDRCLNPSYHRYPYYGGRGIGVCQSWRESFATFMSDMGPRPSSAHSIDRIDNDLGYCAANCRWATSKTQARNTRGNVVIEHAGLSMTLPEWSEHLGISINTLRARRKAGMPIERLLSVKPLTDSQFRRA